MTKKQSTPAEDLLDAIAQQITNGVSFNLSSLSEKQTRSIAKETGLVTGNNWDASKIEFANVRTLIVCYAIFKTQGAEDNIIPLLNVTNNREIYSETTQEAFTASFDKALGGKLKIQSDNGVLKFTKREESAAPSAGKHERDSQGLRYNIH